MKIAHVAVATPKRCGLYETTRELVTGLRSLGFDSRIVDPTRETNTLYPKQPEDRGAPLAGLSWAACEADILVNHSGLGETLEKTAQPVIHIAHGRPRSSFIMEATGGTPIYSYHYRLNAEPRVAAVVTFWPEHVGYLKAMFPDKPVRHVQAPVDLQAWTPDGPSGYGFGGHAGRINVVCTDAWRDDIDPFVPIHAFILWARQHPGAKLHVYGSQKPKQRGWAALFKRIADDGTLGERRGWVNGLDHVYRAANLMLTPHEIDTRSVREALACGCPVVRFPQASLAGLESRMEAGLETPRAAARAAAERLYDPRETARQFADVLVGEARQAA